MVKSKLSDQEHVELGCWVSTGKVDEVIRYVNKLLYERGLKDDGCFFPIAYRKENGCFAKECMEKIISFMEELDKRHDKNTIKKTLNYIRSLNDRPKLSQL
jgi:hypothetical protein